jgi:simple sugar transport system substrate-binding protein
MNSVKLSHVLTIVKLIIAISISPIIFANTKAVFAVPANPGNPFWDIVLRGASDAAKERNVELEVMHYMPNMEEIEIHVLDLALSKPADALIAVLYYQAPKLLKALEKYTADNRVVEIINSGSTALAKANIIGDFIGSNDFQAGFALGKGLADIHINQMTVITDITRTNPAVKKRLAGIKSAVSYAKMKVLDISRSKRPDLAIRNNLKKNTSDTIILINGRTFDYYAKAVKLNKKSSSERNIVAFNLTKKIADSLLSGHTLFTVDEQPYLQGYYGVLNADLYTKYKVKTLHAIMTGPQRIYATDIGPIYDQIGITR